MSLTVTNTETNTDTSTGTKLLTADDLLQLHSQGVHGELIRGVFHKTMLAGEEHGDIEVKLIVRLGSFVEAHGLGRVLPGDAGVRLERDPDTVRGPDVAFLSSRGQALPSLAKGYTEVVPDLVAEIVSPSNSRREMHEKALMWRSFGVRLVWVVHPSTRSVDVYEEDGTVSTLIEDDALSGGDDLPGFSCDIHALFEH